MSLQSNTLEMSTLTITPWKRSVGIYIMSCLTYMYISSGFFFSNLTKTHLKIFLETIWHFTKFGWNDPWMVIFQDCPPGTLAIRLVTLPKIKFLKIAKNCYIFVSYNFVWGRTFQLTWAKWSSKLLLSLCVSLLLSQPSLWCNGWHAYLEGLKCKIHVYFIKWPDGKRLFSENTE